MLLVSVSSSSSTTLIASRRRDGIFVCFLGSLRKMEMVVLVKLQRSSKPEKKWMVTFDRERGRKKTVHFGQASASDFPSHKDMQRRERYLDRHRERERIGEQAG